MNVIMTKFDDTRTSVEIEDNGQWVYKNINTDELIGMLRDCFDMYPEDD